MKTSIFAYLTTLSNSYARQILTQSKVYCNIRKYEVILAIVKQNSVLYSPLKLKNTGYIEKTKNNN